MILPIQGSTTRRIFLAKVGMAGALTLGAAPLLRAAENEGSAEAITPGEDLMREHGVLKRVLLVYREALRRIDAKEPLELSNVAEGAAIIRDFIENYHEKNEETYLFPRFREKKELVDLVDTLQTQHAAGRRVTKVILDRAKQESLNDPSALQTLTEAMREFIRMYEPHEAREDSVLFPAFQKLLGKRDYEKLADTFEESEKKLFGEGGFEKTVAKVAQIEQNLGIYELAQFTPKV